MRTAKRCEYIEATEADVKLAWELASHVLMRSLDDVQTQTRRLLLLLDKMVTAECERLQIERLDYRFTRATVRQFTGWSDSQLKTHLHRLEELEYLALHRGVVRPELRLCAQLRDGRERQAGTAGAELRRKSGRVVGGLTGLGLRRGCLGWRVSGLGRVWAKSGGCLGVVWVRNRQQ